MLVKSLQVEEPTIVVELTINEAVIIYELVNSVKLQKETEKQLRKLIKNKYGEENLVRTEHIFEISEKMGGVLEKVIEKLLPSISKTIEDIENGDYSNNSRVNNS